MLGGTGLACTPPFKGTLTGSSCCWMANRKTGDNAIESSSPRFLQQAVGRDTSPGVGHYGCVVLGSSSASQMGKPRHRKVEEEISNASGASGQIRH